MLNDLHAQRVQEQVLSRNRLIKVEACVTRFSYDGFLRTMLLLQLLNLVHLLRVDEGFEFALAINLALIQEMSGKRRQLAFLLVELTLAELDSFLQVIDLILCILTISLLLGLVPLQLNQVVGKKLPDIRLISCSNT